jgi:hypothetical protein
MNGFLTFCALVGGHAIGDFALQNDFVARFKARTDGNGQALLLQGEVVWPIVLGAHSAIHGFFVGYITGSIWLGILEAIAHALIDYSKCAGKINFKQDQAFHLLCKAVWVVSLGGF